MAQVTLPRTYSNGDSLPASYYNQDLSTLANGINSIDNTQIAANAGISVSKINTGLTGNLVGDTDSQSIGNKTLAAGTKIGIGSDAAGDMYYRASDGSLTRIPVGAEGQVLVIVSGLPTWQSANNYAYSTTTPLSTTSTSFVSMDGTNLTKAITTVNSNKVRVMFNTEFTNNNTGNPLDYFRIVRGSTVVAQMTIQNPNPPLQRAISFCFIDSPPTGANTYDVQWKTSAGTLATLSQGGTLTFSLEEVKI